MRTRGSDYPTSCRVFRDRFGAGSPESPSVAWSPRPGDLAFGAALPLLERGDRRFHGLEDLAAGTFHGRARVLPEVAAQGSLRPGERQPDAAPLQILAELRQPLQRGEVDDVDRAGVD